ncbi:GAF and ANTAR domain-containing protein [Streptomyces sp. JJ36]|uniref:GAF and ANTAR domain-containing protein n=1 Tax=Streptomyces sp. JJ36 TaxID=2736645 RepID=UPI001F34DD60|nr:GAF and ANTAR domain-containing protein [Streptomyces sp. JJ36]MCF6525459.1 GAF and ANTAR domain-containing protein [Streptomyces sp. JJ36]
MSRDEQLARAFVGLADTFSDEFDPLLLFHRLVAASVELLDVDAAAVMMADARGSLRTMAASEDEAEFLELLQLQTGSGPCMDAYRTGLARGVPDLAREREHWPRLVPAALGAGFQAMYTVPLQMHHRVIGAVNFFRTRSGDLPEHHQGLAQALADAAVLALMHWSQEPTTAEDVLSRVQGAISAKTMLEAAKGMIAEYAGVSIAEASGLLRTYAEKNRRRLAETAQALTARDLDPAAVLNGGRPVPPEAGR